jgi:hypothetical protein
MRETAARTAPSVATGRVSLSASGYNANGSLSYGGPVKSFHLPYCILGVEATGWLMSVSRGGSYAMVATKSKSGYGGGNVSFSRRR